MSYIVNDHAILSSEDEKVLFKMYQETKSVALRNYIIEHNIKFAVGAAKTYLKKYQSVCPDDLCQYAIMGLMEAVTRYNYTMKNRFVTYASWWVKATINKYVEQMECSVRYPAHQIREMQRAAKSDVTTPEFDIMIANIKGHAYAKDSSTQITDLADHSELNALDKVEEEELYEMIMTVIETECDEREKRIIFAAYGNKNQDPTVMSELGDELGCSNNYVRLLKSQIIKKLRVRVLELV